VTYRETSYAVLCHSGEDHDTPEDQEVAFYGHVDDATEYRDRLGGDARVYVVRPLSESGHWTWGARNIEGRTMAYVNESAARNSVGSGGTLVRCRAGVADRWEEVTDG
jgi:hypothetical protein